MERSQEMEMGYDDDLRDYLDRRRGIALMGVSGTAKSTPFFENNPMNPLKDVVSHNSLYDVNLF